MKKVLIVIAAVLLSASCLWVAFAQEGRRGSTAESAVLVTSDAAEVRTWLSTKPEEPRFFCVPKWGCGCKGVKDCTDLVLSGSCGGDFRCADAGGDPVCVCDAR